LTLAMADDRFAGRFAMTLWLRRCIVMCALCGCHAEAKPAAKSLTAVKVRAVENANAASGARDSADTGQACRVDLAIKDSSYVETAAKAKGLDGRLRLLQEGDRVAKGTELARIRPADYAHKLNEARAALAEANAAKEQAELDFQRA